MCPKNMIEIEQTFSYSPYKGVRSAPEKKVSRVTPLLSRDTVYNHKALE